MQEIETKQYLKWNDKFGDQNMFMEGKDDDIFYVQWDENGEQHPSMISREKLIQFAKMLEDKH
ncbi:hypothetical protein NOM01_04445 [Sporolactobacillus sp. STSJ-5]|uniref:hypothetical protein n=1 Tax=Sporolactobacillus sp. STSJ-5 TaxID=2965076 RepID=UPI00210708E8|nr:hypothetical protein [Sporolactobacillus sp. STSJ-5]MCQ2009243.1 hypothetical protein [Sporolactobacillus sp. STSJ-5]